MTNVADEQSAAQAVVAPPESLPPIDVAGTPEPPTSYTCQFVISDFRLSLSLSKPS